MLHITLLNLKNASMKNYSEDSLKDRQPLESDEMAKQPQTENKFPYLGYSLKGKVALITGGDSGIGAAIAMLFAKYGIHCIIVYYDEKHDATETVKKIESYGVNTLQFAGDLRDRSFCKEIVDESIKKFGKIDILINNAGVQYEQKDFINIKEEQLLQTFDTNFFSLFYLTQLVVEKMKAGACIVNSTSVTAFRGSGTLIDYASTKGAIVGFTRSLAVQLVDKGIRVNAVAPGPIWTPLIPASFDQEHIDKFGKDTLMKRPGEAKEVAPSYLFLVLEENSYMTGQVLHPNGGEIVA